uniref:Ig-like domain-containing protein n=1 Tax=Sander lucioperca TaxID=283035 RepID=A0A8C9Z4I3_SANLU
MEKLTWCWLLLAALNSALAQNTPKYFTDGGELTLDLRPRPPEPLGDVLWKINVPLTYYRNFKGRTTLDITTGRLVINNMTKADMGVYSAEVNRKVQNERYNAVLIQEVPQPEVEPRPLTCSPASDSCTLSCEAAITEPAGPVTYSWKEGDGEWKGSGKDLNITKNGTLDVETFTCRIQNPVSERDSEPKRNPLLGEGPGSSGVGGIRERVSECVCTVCI